MYKPLEYWKKRKNPAPKALPGYAETYIKRHISNAETLLDFGVGDGRLLHLYEGKRVKGFDIVQRIEGFEYLKRLEGKFDVIIASKVFLHVKPRDIEGIINELKGMCDKMVVFDTIGPCTKEHNFAHDFSAFGEMKERVIINKDLLFVYED